MHVCSLWGVEETLAENVQTRRGGKAASQMSPGECHCVRDQSSLLLGKVWKPVFDSCLRISHPKGERAGIHFHQLLSAPGGVNWVPSQACHSGGKVASSSTRKKQRCWQLEVWRVRSGVRARRWGGGSNRINYSV